MGSPAARRVAASTVASLFAARAREHPARVAITEGERALDYATLEGRVRRLGGLWTALGVRAGDRVAVVSENRAEYLECYLAAAWIGAIVAAPSWRLAVDELADALALVSPALVHASPAHEPAVRAAWAGPVRPFGPDHEAALAQARPAGPPAALDPEDALVILYTSGTTGRPKGAVLSHRAQIARNLVVRAEYGLDPTDAFVAWSPMYHMGGAEYSLGTLMAGGEVIVVGGFDPARIAELVATRELGWLILMPGMVGRLAEVLELDGRGPRGVKVCGVMPDLVPPADLARITRLLGAPYANTFGATETGNPPASAGVVPIGVAPASLAKTPSVFCELRLVGADGEDAPDGSPGECWIRGPTLFSGYWAAPEATAEACPDGWYRMGDVFVRRPDGTLEFVDRAKYLIKTGGENVYPAEIERVLLADPRVAEAAVVRRADPRWGEVPIAFVARRDGALTADELHGACRRSLAGYKQPREIRFLELDAFPRSASGKVVRAALEQRLAGEP